MTRASAETLGILGGGQLGRMLAMAAAKLGISTIIYDPDPDCPAAQTANGHICAAYDDPDERKVFAEACDAVTFEFENIPVCVAEAITQTTPVFPPPRVLEISQDRLTEKNFIRSLGIDTAPFFAVDSLESLQEAANQCDGRGILKTRRLGYDGKGQALIASAPDIKAAWERLSSQPVILEGFVEFDLEISVIGVRSNTGSFVTYDSPQNIHREGILRQSVVPAPLSKDLQGQAWEIASKIANACDYVGVIGVEFFVTADRQLLVNEIAPRVHNSGHWTEAACAVSQFENHVRAVCGLPLGDTGRLVDCEMENLIGDEIEKANSILQERNAVLHLYGKKETRAGRKMGHVTRLKDPA